MKIHTTKENYLTGLPALSLAGVKIKAGNTTINYFGEGREDASGHLPIAGEDLRSTNPIYGDYGVYDATHLVPANLIPGDLRVYAADQYRAVADMIHHSIVTTYEFSFEGAKLTPSKYRVTVELEKWFSGDEDRSQLLDYIGVIWKNVHDDKAEELITWFNKLAI